jgi:hypothetical protein
MELPQSLETGLLGKVWLTVISLLPFEYFSQKSNSWFRYDDMRVTRRKKNDVLVDNAKDAYLFIYKFQ